VLIVYWLVNAAGLAAGREWIGRRLADSSPTRVLLVGTGPEIKEFLEGVGEPRLHHVDVVGAVAVGADGEGETSSPFVGGLPWLGEVGDLPRLLVEHDVGEIVLLSPLSWRDRLVDRMLRQSRRPRVSVVPSVYDILVGRISSGRIHDVPVIEVVKNPRDDLAYLVKRSTDFGLAAVLAIVALPVALAAAVAVKLGSSGPVFYRQRRVGQDGAQFTIWKFRTMLDDAEEGSGPVLASLEDQRVTKVGRVLRAGRIDEIPQLWNVLRGEMSLVGPRPPIAEEVVQYEPWQLRRLDVVPGITCLWQISGRSRIGFQEWMRLDLEYIRHRSFLLDLKILIRTIPAVLSREGAY